jgi:hypothetical protein
MRDIIWSLRNRMNIIGLFGIPGWQVCLIRMKDEPVQIEVTYG